MKNENNQYFAIALLFLVAIIWGSGFIASQMALDAKMGPELIMLVRFSVASVIAAFVFSKKIVKNRSENILEILPSGVFLFFGFFIQIIALQYTTPANNAFLTSTNVVMVPFIWWFLSKKAPPMGIFISSLLCIMGVGILSMNFEDGFTFAIGDWLTVLCAFFFAGHIVLTGIAAKRIETPIIVFYQFLTAAVLSLLAFLIFTDKSLAPLYSPLALGSSLFLGVFSTCLCYFLQAYGQRFVEPSKAAIILGTEALFGSVFSVILGYDLFEWSMVIGGLIIMFALVMTEKVGNA